MSHAGVYLLLIGADSILAENGPILLTRPEQAYACTRPSARGVQEFEGSGLTGA